MKLYLCTITFRHHLVSLPDLMQWASQQGFAGIELWGAHARHAADCPAGSLSPADYGLSLPMLSHYLPLEADEEFLMAEAKALFTLADHWNIGKVRIFAAMRASCAVSSEDRRSIADRLKDLCRMAEGFGQKLLVETHPGTLADTLRSTIRLLDEVDHPALGVNFDALHVWEGGDNPVAARRALLPFIGHYHFKNVRLPDDLFIFEPNNVYAASGRRDGMVPLLKGIYDYRPLMMDIARDADSHISLEWFGGDPFTVLKDDHAALTALHAECLAHSLQRAVA